MMSNKRNVQHQNGNPSSYNLEADDKIHTILHKNEVLKLDFFFKIPHAICVGEHLHSFLKN